MQKSEMGNPHLALLRGSRVYNNPAPKSEARFYAKAATESTADLPDWARDERNYYAFRAASNSAGASTARPLIGDIIKWAVFATATSRPLNDSLTR